MKLRIGILAILMSAMPLWAQTAQQSTASKPPVSPAAQAPVATPPAAPVKKIDPAKEAHIRQLLDVLNSKAAAQKATDNMVEALRSNFQQNLPPTESSQKFIDLFIQKFRAKLTADDLMNESVAVYDQFLSDADVEGMIQFYQSPVGQHVLKVMPQVSDEIGREGFERGQKMAEESLAEVLAEHPELKPAAPQPPAPQKPGEKQ